MWPFRLISWFYEFHLYLVVAAARVPLTLISCQIPSTLHFSLCMGLIRLLMFHTSLASPPFAALDGRLSPQSTALSPGSPGGGRRREATLRRRGFDFCRYSLLFGPGFGFCGTTVMCVGVSASRQTHLAARLPDVPQPHRPVLAAASESLYPVTIATLSLSLSLSLSLLSLSLSHSLSTYLTRARTHKTHTYFLDYDTKVKDGREIKS